jgi:hypothetical protein
MEIPVTAPSTAHERESMGVRHPSRNAQRLQRYRHRRPRIDFYPSPDVLAIVLHHRKAGVDPTLAGIIDGLIRLGHRALSISGNGKS